MLHDFSTDYLSSDFIIDDMVCVQDVSVTSHLQSFYSSF